MSQNPWPFVIVALGSLGFLANSMAQGNRFDEPIDFEQPRSRRVFSDARRQATEETPRAQEADSRFVRSDGNTLENDFDSPFGNQDTSSTVSQFSPEGQTFEDFKRSTLSNREPEMRRDVEAGADITEVTLQGAPLREARNPNSVTRVTQASGTSRSPYDPPVGAGAQGRGRPMGGVRQQPRRQETPLFEPRKFTGRDRQQTFDEAQLDGRRTDTKLTSTLIEGLKSTNVTPTLPLETKKPATTDTVADKVNGWLGSQGRTSSASRTGVPMWLTLGLFFSLPANLFFGWFAMHMHSRYQDLVDDMQASESRLDRHSRSRGRSRDRDDSPRSTRRSHEAEEDAFLHGGIEV